MLLDYNQYTYNQYDNQVGGGGFNQGNYQPQMINNQPQPGFGGQRVMVQHPPKFGREPIETTCQNCHATVSI